MSARTSHKIISLTLGLILLLASLAGVALSIQSIAKPGYSIPKEPASSTESSVVHSSEQKSEKKTLDFEKLRGFLRGFMTKYGAYPLVPGGDEFINATYYGYVSLYLLGEYEFLKRDDVQKALSYFHDERTGGFRDWFGGDVKLSATLWGILINSYLNISFSGFDLSMSLRFINATIANVSVEEINLVDAALLLKVASRYHRTVLNENLTAIEALYDVLPEYILSFYDESIRLFRDHRLSLSPLVQTHFVLEAINIYNSSMIGPEFAESIAYGVLSYRYNLTEEKLLGGFGYNEPTVFETGLSADILCYLSKRVSPNSDLRRVVENETFWLRLFSFVNSSQLKFGGIARNPTSSKVDVFQIFGALMAYLATGKLRSYIESSTSVKPSIQIPVDYEGSIEIEVNVRYFGKFLPLLTGLANVSNLITNESFNASIKQHGNKYLLTLTQVINRTFGNYHVSIRLWRSMGLSALGFNSSLYFRIGYNVSLTLSQSIVRPGGVVNVTISARFYNGTFVNGSTFILYLLRIVDGTKYTQKYFEMNGTRNVTIKCEFPRNASLGEHAILVVANDTHGFNHTFAKRVISVDDHIIYGEIVGKADKYHVGDRITVKITNLTYNSTRVPIPANPNVSIEVRYRSSNFVYSRLSGLVFEDKNSNQTVALIEGSLSPIIPKDLNVSLHLILEWDKSIAGTKSIWLFNASLILEKLDVTNVTIILNGSFIPINESALYIGRSYNVCMQLVHEFTSSSLNSTSIVVIENASLMVYINYSNKSWSKSSTKYNDSLKIYIYELYVDPNLPESSHNLTIRVNLEFNSSYRDIIKSVYILGKPKIVDWSMPDKTYVGEYFSATFKLLCNETGEILRNVSLSANVTIRSGSKNRTLVIPIAYTDITYYLSIYADSIADVEGIVYRSLDNLVLLNFSTKFVAREKPFTIDPWILPLIVITTSYAGFILLRGKYLRRIPKRFLIERRP